MSAARHKIAVAVAVAVGLASAQLSFGVYADAAANEWPLYYLLVGPVAGLLYYYVVAATLEYTALWLAACALGAWIFLVWFARPVLYEGLIAGVAESRGPEIAVVGRED